MARKTKELTITAEGRDQGKVFILTEPSSFDSERLAGRFWLMMARAGAKVPPELRKAGMAGVATMLQGDFADMLPYLSWDELEPLLNELMECARYRHAAGHPLQKIVEGESCPVEEIATRFQLKMEVFELITGFSLVG